MSIYLATYYPGYIPIGLCNFLKVLFSTNRINSLIHTEKEVPCVDKEFDWILNSIFDNHEYVYPELVQNSPLCTIDNMSIFLDRAIYHVDGRKNTFDQNDKTPVYRNDGWRFYVMPSEVSEMKPFANEWYLRDQPRSIDLKYTNIPQNVRDIYLNIIKKFKIKDFLEKYVESIAQKIDGDYLSVHIRTWFSHLWDIETKINERHQWYLQVRSQYIDAINRNPLKKVLICTDSIDQVKMLLPYLNSDKEVHFYESNSEFSRLQNDFCELLLLSKGKYLIGTNNSTFSELAWWYSNCEQTVEIF
jgi:hypothetical protein